MTNRQKPFSRVSGRHSLPQALAATLSAVVLASCTPYGERIAPIPLPSSHGDHIDIQGAQMTARPYLDAKQAEAAFGFDIRGAGLLPVRFALDNQSSSVVRINPQQTFLIDSEGQAWPVLTAEQAYNRINRAIEFQEIGKGAGKSAVLIGAAGAVTGFALGVLLGEGVGKTTLQGIEVGAPVGAFFGGTDAAYGLETKIRQDLVSKTLRNQRVQPGELAYGVLFFPGREEARSASSLRLSVELDSYPQVVNLPLNRLTTVP